ncbi:GNAT family N-acetyltransferase [Magnetococcales bacterium HHB-1]
MMHSKTDSNKNQLIYRTLTAAHHDQWSSEAVALARSCQNDPRLNQHRDAFYGKHIPPKGISFGVYVEERLVGLGLFGFASLMHPEVIPYMAHYNDPPERFGYFSHLLVAAAWRRQGIGQQLVRKRLHYAQSHGIRHLFVILHPQNQGSMALLKQNGFHEIDRKIFQDKQRLRAVMYRALIEA